MGWEWRSFMLLDGSKKEALDKQEALTFAGKKKVEERSDLYLFLSNIDSDKKANYGIKFRDVREKAGVFQSNRLELKILYSRDKEGREDWSKVVSDKLSQKCDLFKITRQTDASPLEESKAGEAKSDTFTIYYKNILQALDEVFLQKTVPGGDEYFLKAIAGLKSCTSMTFYFVPKKRVQAMSDSGFASIEKAFGGIVKLEAKSLDDQIICTPSKDCYFRSICIESGDYIRLEDIADLKKKQNEYEETIVAGYPGFLLQL